ncbi:MAG: phosphopantetheine-binding protein [Anditalea sp.]
MELYEKLYTIIEDVTGYPKLEIIPELKLVENLGLDPLKKLELIFAIEIGFQIDIPAQKVYTIKKVADLINEIRWEKI